MEHVCNTVHKLGAFRHGRRNLSHAARRMFYLSVLQSTLDYASSAYCHCLSQSLYNRLVVCSHNAMKKTFGMDRCTPTDLVLRSCKLYSLELRINLKLYVFVYRCISQLASPLLQKLFVLRRDVVLILLLLLVANSHMLLTYHQDELAMDTSLFLF